MSFAHIVFASAHLKRYHPAAFCAGLLRAQPMGFYSPQSLVADARRHGVAFRAPDLHASQVHPHLEADADSTGGVAVRFGLARIKTIGETLAQRIVEERAAHGPYGDQADLVRRCQLSRTQLENLATAGVFAVFGSDRRRALWDAGAAARERVDALPGTTMTTNAPILPGMTVLDLLRADLTATGVSADHQPAELLRAHFAEQDAIAVSKLVAVAPDTRIRVGGVVTHRQRPPTARGITFLNLEDETGMINVVVRAEVWTKNRSVWRDSTALVIRGMLRRSREGVLSLDAESAQPVPIQLRPAVPSRDYR